MEFLLFIILKTAVQENFLDFLEIPLLRSEGLVNGGGSATTSRFLEVIFSK